MKPILRMVILFLILLELPAWGADRPSIRRPRPGAYPLLYRGKVMESGPRLLAHFNKIPPDLKSGEPFTTLATIERELEALRLEGRLRPGSEEKELLSRRDSIIADRIGQIYYVISGEAFYPIRAKDFHLVHREDHCGRTLAVEVETEWVRPESTHEKSGAPPLLNLNLDPDGPLIFGGRRFKPSRIDTLRQTKFHPIRFPEDLPKGLREEFKEEIESVEADRSSSYHLYAPLTGFLPLELTISNDQTPKEMALYFYYEKQGTWKEVPFPFEHQPRGLPKVRPISRFDLNQNGKMEYLVEVEEANQTTRHIYEMDEERGEVFFMASTADQLFVEESKEPLCREKERVPTIPPSEVTAQKP
ncbi:MAG: hypothetical protein MPW17_09010 [Candidatus Manganitrophus sp.]|nr:hypothetical protein [Candidatus Manganitrophus sp.]MDC4225714.1 hypothetical protein [Candidatus Manganitrophus sp.]WDT72959.1 MAG: hypothetical protein MPW17_09010 [Candidatus Manganitrophus sp.]